MQAQATDPNEALTPPLAWPWALEATPFVSSEATHWRGAMLRGWRGTSAVMVQPPLDHHYVVMHLDGAKQVTRRRDGCAVSTVAENGSLTLVPAGTAYLWRTVGPIAFAHLYVHPAQLEDFLARELDADARSVSLIDCVGSRDALLEPLFVKMLEVLGTTARPSTLLLDSLLESFMAGLTQRHLSAPMGRPTCAVSLAPHRLRRVLEFMEANLGQDLALADLVAAAGTSQSHFSRAFHLATGHSPYRYLLQRRIEYARVLLMTTVQSIEAISSTCGFNSRRQFAVMFKRSVGVSPKQFQVLYREVVLRSCTPRQVETVRRPDGRDGPGKGAGRP